MPPELNTARLMMGGGPQSALQASGGWGELSVSLNTQAEELAAQLAALKASWSGTSSDKAIAAMTTMVDHLLNASRPYIIRGKVEQDLGVTTLTALSLEFLDGGRRRQDRLK